MDFTLLDHLLNPVIVVDKEQKIIYFNHICSTYFKLPPRKLNKLEKLDELLVCDQDNIEKNFEQALSSKTPIISREIEVSLPENAETTMTVLLKMIPQEDYVLIHLWDMSIEKQLHEKYKKQIGQLKENHEQIMMADKLTALGELIAGIGHEVSNPMMIISDRLFHLQESLIKKDLKALKANLTDVDREIKRVNKIIANMQSFVKNQDEEVGIISLQNVVEESINFIKELNVLGKIKLEVNIKEDQLILANALKVQQVIINLIKNAIDALQLTENPIIKITIEADLGEQMSIIRVEDNGPGIEQEAKDKLFDMFYTSKELGEGTGLGLSISQKIIESYYGQVLLEEGSVGASFLVQLPFIEFSTFTRSNAYLNGQKEVEDPKLILLGENLSSLNSVFKSLEKEDFVVIVTQNDKDIDELVDFYDAKLILLTEKKNIESEIETLLISPDIDIEAIKKMVTE